VLLAQRRQNEPYDSLYHLIQGSTSSGERGAGNAQTLHRRTIKPDVWKYHLRQMAAAQDPIEYLCRFLPAQDQVKVRSSSNPEPIAAQA